MLAAVGLLGVAAACSELYGTYGVNALHAAAAHEETNPLRLAELTIQWT